MCVKFETHKRIKTQKDKKKTTHNTIKVRERGDESEIYRKENSTYN